MIEDVEHVHFVVREGFHHRPRRNEIWVKTEMIARNIANDILVLLEEHDHVLVSCMGPKAIGKGVKAHAIARDLFHEDTGYDILCRPYFSIVDDRQNTEKTRITMRLDKCSLQPFVKDSTD